MYINQPVPSRLAISILTLCGLMTCFLVFKVSQEVSKVYDSSLVFSISGGHGHEGAMTNQ
jgi:hypothetical protein